MFQKVAASFIIERELKGNSIHFELTNLDKHKEELEEKGLTYLGKIINDDVIDKLTKYINKLNCFDPWQQNLGEFTIDKVDDTTHTASYKREDLIKEKIIFEIANNSSILEIVKDYLKATPTISNINAWWSFAGRKSAQEAQNFHRDNDDIKFCKFFIYLTDVTEESGPHIYVEKSSGSQNLRKIKRLSDEEVKASFNQDLIQTLIFPKGHAFLEDTYGIHKGQLPRSENRLLLQIEYSLSPIGYIKYKPVTVNGYTNYSKYINRLVIK
ncbi:hypothetical protein JMN32_26350 [Fulvivirga sp. 29W222]|uniref:Phytanoyl-CoA dioxygenase n=1 Tax=Fulvivirga marina TaxID=2494733 RepID=A0A937G7I8_9BACT|nr:hypothetical protein [Fulvivirga marina]MBL6449861.1 hypothetical protein [Fulvivirga marina]